MEASVRLGPKTLRTLDEEVKSLVSAWRFLFLIMSHFFGWNLPERLFNHQTYVVSYLWIGVGKRDAVNNMSLVWKPWIRNQILFYIFSLLLIVMCLAVGFLQTSLGSQEWITFHIVIKGISSSNGMLNMKKKETRI